jgi:hypothetical protein
MLLNKDLTHNFEFDIVFNKEGESDKSLVVRADTGIDETISGTIPNQTTLLFVLTKTGKVLKKYTYGLTHNLKYLPPEEESLLTQRPD